MVKRARLLMELEKVGAGEHTLALQLLGNQDDAADVLQDALVAMLGSQSFDPAQGSFKSWFLTVVRNRCLDLLRQRRPQVAIDEVRMAAGSTGDPESAFEQDEMQAILKRELRRLTARGKSRHGIRPSLHPGGLRCSSVTYGRICSLRAPCPAGAGTVSVLAGLSPRTANGRPAGDPDLAGVPRPDLCGDWPGPWISSGNGHVAPAPRAARPCQEDESL